MIHGPSNGEAPRIGTSAASLSRMRLTFALLASLVVVSLNTACMNEQAETIPPPAAQNAPEQLNLVCTAVIEPLPEGAGLGLFVAGASPVVATTCGSAGTTNVPLAADQSVTLVENYKTRRGQTVDVTAQASGDEIIFAMKVRETGETFFSGPGSRNPDGSVHAAVLVRTDGLVLVGFDSTTEGDFNDVVLMVNGELAIR